MFFRPCFSGPGGKVPSNRFLLKSTKERSRRPQSSAGIEPLSTLELTLIATSRCKYPSDVGKAPCK